MFLTVAQDEPYKVPVTYFSGNFIKILNIKNFFERFLSEGQALDGS